MSERRPRSGRVAGVAEGVAAAVRRRQREREPRVVIADPTGATRIVAPSPPGYDDLLDTAARMLDAVGGLGDRRPPSTPAARSRASDEPIR